MAPERSVFLSLDLEDIGVSGLLEVGVRWRGREGAGGQRPVGTCQVVTAPGSCSGAGCLAGGERWRAADNGKVGSTARESRHLVLPISLGSFPLALCRMTLKDPASLAVLTGAQSKSRTSQLVWRPLREQAPGSQRACI